VSEGGATGTTVGTHVLDRVAGRPAAGVVVALERLDGALWAAVSTGTTDGDGRVAALAPDGVAPGVHRLVFATGAWFAAVGRPSFYPEVTIVFTVAPGDAHLHVPLLLAPYAYSTYRGS
jgi:5-hydroxyisourate hydrolase